MPPSRPRTRYGEARPDVSPRTTPMITVATTRRPGRVPARPAGTRLLASIDVEWTKNYRVRNGNVPFCYSVTYLAIPTSGPATSEPAPTTAGAPTTAAPVTTAAPATTEPSTTAAPASTSAVCTNTSPSG